MEVKTFGLKRGAVLLVIALWVAGIAASCSHRQADPQAAQPSQPGAGLTVGFSHVVDLTHTLTAEFPYIPVPGITFPFRLTPIATMDKQGVAANRWDIHEHLGTQIDAPSHFISGGASLDQIPAQTLIAPLAVIDISARTQGDPDTSVTTDDLVAWERVHGRLPNGAAVFMSSGWDRKVADAKAFVNLDSSGTMHFPGFSPEAAKWLATERSVVGIGVDTLSLDPGRDHAYTTHKTWLATGKWGVECVANLRQVPAAGATVFVGATKVGGATGGPVRLLAAWTDRRAGTPAVHRHAGEAADAFANAYLIETRTGIVAIDGLMTVSEADRLRARLDALNKPLLAVLLTHPHPDHYGGIARLVASQSVPVIATKRVADIVSRDDAAKDAALKRAGVAWPLQRVFPARVLRSGESITFDEVRFTVFDTGRGESHADAYWVMDSVEPVAFSGDLLVSGVHAYLADGHSGSWLKTLEALRTSRSDIRVWYPGHGDSGGWELFDRTKEYLETYRSLVRDLARGASTLSPPQKKELAARMAERFRDYRQAAFVIRSADAVAAELAQK